MSKTTKHAQKRETSNLSHVWDRRAIVGSREVNLYDYTDKPAVSQPWNTTFEIPAAMIQKVVQIELLAWTT